MRIKTELAQTSVTVFDRQGRRVDGLRKEDFLLQIGGRPVSIAFFDSVAAGSEKDRTPLKARTGAADAPSAPPGLPQRQPRTVIFFVDDYHLGLKSLDRTRSMLHDFIEKQIGPGDQAAIASSSGRVGFLQQFSDNRDVLRAAAGRLGHVAMEATDYGRNTGAPMSEYHALSIDRKDDPGVLNAYVDVCVRSGSKGSDVRTRLVVREGCKVEVMNRARHILTQAGAITQSTYSAFETLLQTAERMEGSKLAFFISDGFLADTGPRGRVTIDKLKTITDAARRAGVVIYSIDAKGLVSGALEASGNVLMDAEGRLEAANLRAIAASQDALNALAVDSGGRALRNQGYFEKFVGEALDETSHFYLIAWTPEASDAGKGKLENLEISVLNRPDLTVRFGRVIGVDRPAPVQKTPQEKKETGPAAELREALGDPVPLRAIPLHLSLVYVDAPANGPLLTSSIAFPVDAVSHGNGGNEPAQVTVAGIVLDDKGKPAARFGTGLKVAPGSGSNVIYNYPAPMKPGIYQVRAAARDDRSGLIGTAHQWIKIPDLSTQQLSLSNVLIEQAGAESRNAERIQWSVDRTFPAGSRLRILAFIYNAARKDGGSPDLSAAVNISGAGRGAPLRSSKNAAVDLKGDPARIPVAAEVDLRDLASGRYLLDLTVQDRISRKSVSLQVPITIR